MLSLLHAWHTIDVIACGCSGSASTELSVAIKYGWKVSECTTYTKSSGGVTGCGIVCMNQC